MNRMFFLLPSIASLIPFGNRMKVTAHVKDTEGNPAVGAIVKVWTDKDHFQGLCKGSTYSYYEAVADTNGMAVISFPCYSSSIYGCAYGDLYYREDSGHIPIKSTFNWADFSVTLTEHSKEISFTLRRKRNPTSLCYRQPSPWIKLPDGGDEFGFDLLMSDWIAPYGEGMTADFYVQREVSPTNRQMTIDGGLVFRGEGNGAYIRKKVKTTSNFKTDYEADTNGTYQTCLPLRRIPIPGAPMYTNSVIITEDEYIVMRTRVEKDAKGNIIKAHYSTMLGAIQMYQHFRNLGYVFNPIPNDPNLEKDFECSTDLERAKWERRHPRKRKDRRAR